MSADYTVRWDGVIYRVKREQLARGMRGARVLVERRLDGTRWMHWHNRVLTLARCETKPELVVERRIKSPVIPERSVGERARARQRLLVAFFASVFTK